MSSDQVESELFACSGGKLVEAELDYCTYGLALAQHCVMRRVWYVAWLLNFQFVAVPMDSQIVIASQYEIRLAQNKLGGIDLHYWSKGYHFLLGWMNVNMGSTYCFQLTLSWTLLQLPRNTVVDIQEKCFDGVLTDQLVVLRSIATAQTRELTCTEHMRDKYIKRCGEDMFLIVNHEQNTYHSFVLLVIPELLLSLQGLQGLNLFIVREPQGVLWIAINHVVTCVNVFNAHVQWDPGGFLSTMSGENEPNYTERSWRMHIIGAQGYRLIIDMNYLSAPWDPGIIAIYELVVPVHVKPRQPQC